MSDLPQVCLAIDYGLKSIGIAVGQTITCSAQALTAISAKNGEPDWAELDKIVAQWQPQMILLGLPLHIEGTDQPITRAVRGFYKHLQARYSQPIEWVDERFTTVEAKKNLIEQQGSRSLNKQAIDSESARLICQQWLNKML